MADQKTIEMYNASVASYVDLTSTNEPDAPLKHFLSKLQKGDTILDFGCGPGQDANFMVQAGMKVDAVDASSEMVRLANDHFGIDARQATFDDLDAENQYQAIWANFSLLHATPSAFPLHIKAIAKALTDDGYFHIGMKTGTGVKRDTLGRQYAYYEEQELRDVLEAYGFYIDTITKGEAMGMAGHVEPWITILSQKR